ncbi:MAG: helix-turn-helix transcriptional regulator [Clostridia bacterium]|nr:helix-turn-helix transcriptional regulator [Clostridia bacterium]
MKSVERKVSPVSDYFIYTPSKIAQEVFLYPMQCGVFTYEPGYMLNRNSFDSFLLMYIQKGSMLLDFDGKKQQVAEKNFVLLDCYQPHGYSTEKGYECLWLHFDGVMARKYYQIIVSRLGNVFTMGDVFSVVRRLNAILRIFFDHQTVREPLLSKYITDILTEFMILSPEKDNARNYTDLTEKAITYINEHFFEDISIDQLAALSGLSRYYFIRVFKQETGYTPHEYLVNRRMASARYLLKYSSLNTKEICFQSGFSGESVFCCAFKKQHGMTPLQYRESSNKKQEDN